mgnify:CR=1 FL=1
MKKKIVLLVMLLLLVVGGTLVGIYWDPIIDWLPIDQSGWEEMKTGGICYLDEDGDPIPGWLEIESNIYYFDPQSYAMQTGWLQLEDERFTSVLAHRAMIDGGMKKQDRMKKESVDKISAAIILQSYLDRKK